MLKLKTNLHLLGPQGSGKGTQAEILASELGFRHISVGDLLRKRSMADDDLAKNLKSELDAGKLAPDHLVKQVLETEIIKNQNSSGFIFDGTLRHLDQVKFMQSMWTNLSLDEPFVIVLEIEDEESIRRTSKRMVCPKCNYITFAVNENDLNCPKCGTLMVKRSDDTPEAIQKRLKIYHNNTEPVITYFQSLHRVIIIDGRPSIEVVSEAIIQKIKQNNIISL